MPAKYQPYIYFIIETLIMLNAFLTAKGVNPVTISDAEIYIAVSYIVAVGAFFFAIWKNHNFTEAARIAQQTLDQIKAGADPEELYKYGAEELDTEPEEHDGE